MVRRVCRRVDVPFCVHSEGRQQVSVIVPGRIFDLPVLDLLPPPHQSQEVDLRVCVCVNAYVDELASVGYVRVCLVECVCGSACASL